MMGQLVRPGQACVPMCFPPAACRDCHVADLQGMVDGLFVVAEKLRRRLRPMPDPYELRRVPLDQVRAKLQRDGAQ